MKKHRNPLCILTSALVLSAAAVAATPAMAGAPAESRRSDGARLDDGFVRAGRTVVPPLQLCAVSMTGAAPEANAAPVEVIVGSLGDEFEAPKAEVLDAAWTVEVIPGKLPVLNLRPARAPEVGGETPSSCFELRGFDRRRAAVSVVSATSLAGR